MSKHYIPSRDGMPTRMPRRRMLRPNKPTAKKLARKVALLQMGQEKRFYNTSLANQAITATTDWSASVYDPTATSLISTPAVGSGESDRDGKKIAVYSLLVNGTINWPAQTNQTAADQVGPAFVALVLDKQTNGAALSSINVFINPTAAATGIVAPLRDQNFKKRFRVLRVKVLPGPVLPITYDGTNIEQSGMVKHFKFFVRFKKPLIINFNSGTTASVANVLDKSIHVLANHSSSADAAITMTYNAQMIYVG